MFCTKCGKQNSAETKFCVDCGNPLKPSTTQATKVHENESTTTQHVESSGIAVQENPIVASPSTVSSRSVVPPAIKPAPVIHEPINNIGSQESDRSKYEQKAAPRKSKTGGILVVIILLILAGGGVAYWFYNKHQDQKYFSREYKGTIDNQYVNMNIVRQGYVLSGIVKFDPRTNRANAILQGTVKSDESFSLYPEDNSFSYSGTFIGKNIIRGSFSAKNTSQASIFSLFSNSKE